MGKIVVIDFEKTGLSPALGDRATEVAAVIIKDHDPAKFFCASPDLAAPLGWFE